MKSLPLHRPLLLAALAGGLALLWVAAQATLTPPRAGTLELLDTDGRPLRLGAGAAPTLLTFWASDCKACLKEIPQLTRLNRELGPRGLQVIGVSMYYDAPIYVMEAARRHGIAYPLAMDLDKRIARFLNLNPMVTPTTYLIDGSGRVLLNRSGTLDAAELRTRIERILPAAAARPS